MNSEPEIISRRLFINGFIYIYSREKNGNKYWDCKILRSKECTARAITKWNGGELVIIKGLDPKDHAHPANREEAEAEKVQLKLKRKAEDHPELPPAKILRTELAGISGGVLSHLPERENIKKSLRRIRRRNLPPNPTSIMELGEIPDIFQRTVTGDRFLIHDSENNLDGRVLVFSTKRNLELLALSEMWYLDGTFKVILNFFCLFLF